jgi:hypothetical protein
MQHTYTDTQKRTNKKEKKKRETTKTMRTSLGINTDQQREFEEKERVSQDIL